MKKRFLHSMALCLSTAFVLSAVSACGGGGSQPAGNQPASGQASADPASSAPESGAGDTVENTSASGQQDSGGGGDAGSTPRHETVY